MNNHRSCSLVPPLRLGPSARSAAFPAIVLALAIGCLALPIEASPQQVTRLRVVPPAAAVGVAQAAVLDIAVEAATDVWGARFVLTFDPSVLEVVDADSTSDGVQIAPGPYLDPREGRSWRLVNRADNTAGRIEYAAVLLNNARSPTPPAAGSGVLAQVTFRAIEEGTSPIAFVKERTEVYDGRGSAVAVSTTDGRLEVSSGRKIYLPVAARQHTLGGGSSRLSGVPAAAALNQATVSESAPLQPLVRPRGESGSGMDGEATSHATMGLDRLGGRSTGGSVAPVGAMPPTSDGPCSGTPPTRPSFLSEHVGPDESGARYSYYHVWYTTDCRGDPDCDCDGTSPDDCVPAVDDDGDGVPNVVETVAYTLQSTRQKLTSQLGFREPFFCSTTMRQAWIHDIGAGGYGWPTNIDLNRDSLVLAGTQQVNVEGTQSTALHELFHTTQFAYIDANVWTDWGGWLVEGTAVLAEDSLFADPAYADMVDLDHLGIYNLWSADYLRNPNIRLNDVYYGMAIFWKFLVEQYGRTPAATNVPEYHLDALRVLWEETVDREPDAVGAVESALRTLGAGNSFDDLYLRFQIANYLKELDAASLPAEYRYSDLQEAGGALQAVPRTVRETMPASDRLAGEADVVPWGALYLEVSPAADVEMLTVKIDADHRVGHALAVADGGKLVNLIGPQTSSSFAHTVINNGYDTVAYIVGGAEDGGHLEYAFDSHPPTVDIQAPTASEPAVVAAGAEGKVLIQLRVLPPGAGELPVPGVPLDGFKVTIGGVELAADQILERSEVQDQYWLLAQVPEELAAGQYDLRVALGSASAHEARAVTVGERVSTDSVLVLDRSGSMAESEKMADAQNAARLFASSWTSGDKIGVVSFNETATVNYALHDWTPANRDAAIAAINGIAAGGRTSIGSGLIAANGEVLRGDQDDAWGLVLLSDGVENAEPPMADFLAAYARRAERGQKNPTVYAVAIGPDAAREDLQALADATGGEYLYVSEPKGASPFGASGAAQEPGTTDLASSAAQEPGTTDLANDLAEAFRTVAEGIARRQRVYLARDTSVKMPANQALPHRVEIDRSATEAVFVVNWRHTNSTYSPRVRLVAPGGRSVDPTVSGDTHVVFQVTGPQAGTWTVEVTRFCDPYNHCFEGSYLVEAAVASALQMDLLVGPAVRARVEGATVPVLVSLAADRPVTGATVEAEIKAPSGTTFRIELLDDGQHGDGTAEDGVYGQTFRHATEPGSYSVRATAKGTAPGVGDFQRRAMRAFHLAADANADGDCMPDGWERAHDLDPAVRDGQGDPDGDGLNNCDEYTNGTDPHDPDSDGAGQEDGSEVSHGDDPLDPEDDHLRPPRDFRVVPGDRENKLVFGVAPEYDHLMIYRSRTKDGTYQVLADRAPAETPYVDRGLTNGVTYWYRLRALDAEGRRSRLTPPDSATPKADPIPPFGRVVIDGGARATRSRDIRLTLTAVDDKPPFPDAPARPAANAPQQVGGLQMRLANDANLDGASWQPFAPSVAWTIQPVGRRASVYAQFRDEAGNVSPLAMDSIAFVSQPPPACPRGGQVDLVFLMDTSGSMDDEFAALCGRIGGVVASLQDSGITVHHTVLGVTQNKMCATDNVAHRIPGAAANTPEDWGVAVADVAGAFPWRVGHTRLIVPFADEGPGDGDPAEDPGADREAIEAAIEAARQNQVIVSPVLGTFIEEDPANQAAIERLANDLARATGGQVLHSTDSADELADGLARLIGTAACTPVVQGVHPNCGIGAETPVQVFGQNFVAGAQVLVAGQPARDVTVGPDLDRIAFRIPQGLAEGTYDVTVVNAAAARYTLRAALTVGPCTARCVRAVAGDIWTPMWDLQDGEMDLLPRADDSSQLSAAVFSGQGDLVVTLLDAQGNRLDQAHVAAGQTGLVSVASTADAIYRLNVRGSGADHPRFRAVFRGAKHVAMADNGDDWARTEGVPFPGSGPDRGVESSPELGFDERWQEVGSAYADTTWYFPVASGDAKLQVRLWSEYPEGDGHGGIDWLTPEEIAIPLVGPEPPGFVHTFSVPNPQPGWWGLRIKAEAPFSPWAQRYSLARLGEAGDPSPQLGFAYLLPTSMRPPPCGPTVSLEPPRQGVCRGADVPVDILVSDVNNLYGAEVHLSFDPAQLMVVDASGAPTDAILPGPYPDPAGGQRIVALNHVDNSAGTIDYAVTLVHPAPAAFGDGHLARVLFRSKGVGPSTVRFTGGKLDERPVPPAGPTEIPAQFHGAVVIGRNCVPGQAGQGEMTGQVALQGRTSQAGAVVSAAPWPHLQITGPDGAYRLAPLQPGQYTVVITHTGYLRTDPRPVALSAGQPLRLPDAVLLGGDVDGDGAINFRDAVMVSLAFTFQRGESGYAAAADIDDDGVVDIDDLVLIGANWECTVQDTSARCRRWQE